jgi:mono/diheme cytochrome c family protein
VPDLGLLRDHDLGSGAVTEIPEHLLKRSKQRRAAIGGEDTAAAGDTADAGDAAAGQEAAPAEPAATPATTAAAAPPAETTPPPAPEPEPVRPEVAAYQNRRRIPYWAMPVLAFLPLWAYMYQATLEPPPAGETGPMAVGGEAYNPCSACHGSGGGGGSGPALDAVGEVFPDFRDHLMWVRVGSQGWPGDTYGANDQPKGGGMPPHNAGILSAEDLAAVVLYERVQFGGITEEEEEDLVAVAEGEMTLTEVGVGELSEAAGLGEADLEG